MKSKEEILEDSSPYAYGSSWEDMDLLVPKCDALKAMQSYSDQTNAALTEQLKEAREEIERLKRSSAQKYG